MGCNEAYVTFVKALFEHLKANGKRVVSIASLTGQKHILISIYGLMKHHDPSLGYLRFSHVMNELINECDLDEVLARYKCEIVEENGEIHLKFPLDFLSKLVDMSFDNILGLFRRNDKST